ncbi:hypothetical protein [Flavihumibacter sp.]|uniref:hypothetical protein n=1 Tax=Flavihumibacter sp. TaxID=1913981 RepID=UPI002FCC50C6|nr:hypothetical protein [Flavihumibacter sediminis]
MRRSNTSLLLAGLAAYAYYKYSRMNQQDKDKMVKDLKDKGRSLVEQINPFRTTAENGVKSMSPRTHVG